VAGLPFKHPAPEWHEKALVSEVALQVARRQMAVRLDESLLGELTPKLAAWICEADTKVSQNAVPRAETVSASSLRAQISDMKGIQLLLTAAHEHFPDTSIDAARCSQLQEGINLVLRKLERALEAESAKAVPSSSLASAGADADKETDDSVEAGRDDASSS
jgi:hypothetical protein